VIEPVQVELQARRHAEVAAAAPQPPEKLRILVGGRHDQGSVRSDELRAGEVVARETVLSGQVADTSAERESAHAGGADDASRSDEAVRLRGRVEIEPGSAAGSPRDSRVGLHLDPPHCREVDHEAVVTDAVAGGVVPASPNGDLQLMGAGKVERGRDVSGDDATYDDRGPSIDEGVEAPARRVVPRIGSIEDLADQRSPQLVQAHLDVGAHASVSPGHVRLGTWRSG